MIIPMLFLNFFLCFLFFGLVCQMKAPEVTIIGEEEYICSASLPFFLKVISLIN